LAASPKLDQLPTGEVHVWIAAVDGPTLDPDSLAVVLSPDERQRAASFRFEKHRRRYIAAHAALRQILSRYLGKPAEDIVFACNRFGKPFLCETDGMASVSFNMSHSGELALAAFARGRLIGADVELIRPVEEFEQIAEAHFTPQELTLLEQADIASRQHTFYTCWTRKEAYIKAIGKGLSIPLNSFDTSIPAGAAGRRIERSPDAPHVASWWLSDLVVDFGYAAALVVEDGFDRICYRRWPE
jgi:4'-phosphopantetheinyl transferase